MIKIQSAMNTPPSPVRYMYTNLKALIRLVCKIQIQEKSRQEKYFQNTCVPACIPLRYIILKVFIKLFRVKVLSLFSKMII